MVVSAQGEEAPDCHVQQPASDKVQVKARFPHGTATVHIHLVVDAAHEKPIIEAKYEPSSGEMESLSVK
jgi:hypothetical protein